MVKKLTEDKTVNQSEFAKLAGVSAPYVNKLVKQGKLGDAVIKKRGGGIRIDPDKAFKNLRQTLTATQPTKIKDETGEQLEVDGQADNGKRKSKAHYDVEWAKLKLDMKQFEFDQKRGRFVEKQKVKEAAFQIARTLRDHIMQIIPSIKAVVSKEVGDIIEKEIVYGLEAAEKNLRKLGGKAKD